MKQKWDEDWNQSLNQMTRMRLEEHKGTCDFAFPEGDLAYGGQEGICPTVHGEEGGGGPERSRGQLAQSMPPKSFPTWRVI